MDMDTERKIKTLKKIRSMRKSSLSNIDMDRLKNLKDQIKKELRELTSEERNIILINCK
jgi:hypothetical protein